MENNWEKYVENTKESNPRPLLVKAIEFVKEKDEALDLGSGAMNDVKYLISSGFKHVTAIDHEPVAKNFIQDFPSENFNYIISNFENMNLTENKYDLINAEFSLPFNPKETFNEVWDKIIGSLKAGGVIVGQFFGPSDEWNTGREDMNFQTLEETEQFLSELNVVQFRENEKDDTTAAGNVKHWHVFHFIAIKK